VKPILFFKASFWLFCKWYNFFISVYCITAVGAEESCRVQPTVSEVATAEQHSQKSSEARKKHKRKHHKRRRKAGMYWS